MNKFLGYEKNEDMASKEKGFLGIATVLRESKETGREILNFMVNTGKDGKGVFIKPFSKFLNGNWKEAFVLDSNIEMQEIQQLIRSGMNGYTAPQPKQESFIDDSKCPF